MSVFINTPPVAKVLSWQQHKGCHFVSFVMHIYDAKFQEHCFKNSIVLLLQLDSNALFAELLRFMPLNRVRWLLI